MALSGIAKTIERVLAAVEKLKFGHQSSPELLFADDVRKAIKGVGDES